MSVVTSCHVLSALESFLPKLKSFERCRNCMRPRMHFPGTCDCFAQSRCSHALHLREADDILQPFTGAQLAKLRMKRRRKRRKEEEGQFTCLGMSSNCFKIAMPPKLPFQRLHLHEASFCALDSFQHLHLERFGLL